jgi:hypothetical protein
MLLSDDKILGQTLRRLQSASDISEEDKTPIVKLVECLLAKGVSNQRTIKCVNDLIVATRIASRPLGQLDKKDMEVPVGRINMAGYTENTRHHYMIIIKKCFQWLRGCDENQHEYPEEVR